MQEQQPAQAVCLTGEEISAYSAAAPADDARFIAVFAHSLEHAPRMRCYPV
jgi:hypothetical protein